MSRIGDSLVFHVDSDLRFSGTHSNFEYKIPSPQGFDYVAVVQATIPKTYYLVQAGYNSITLVEEGKSVTIEVPPGNYTVKNFRTTFLALLNSLTPNSRTYTMQLSTITGKYTFGTTSSSASFVMPNQTGLNKQLGFEKTTTNTFTAGILQSVNIGTFVLTNAVYIKSNIFASSETQPTSDSILQEIFNSSVTNDFAFIQFQNYNTELTAKRIKMDADQYNFSITDTDDRVLDLNGQSVNFSLVFYRSNDDYYKAQLGAIKLKLFDQLNQQ